LAQCERRVAREAPDLKVAFHRKLIDHAGDGVARELELAGQFTARRQVTAGRQRAVQDRAAQLVVKLPVQRFALWPLLWPGGKVDQAGENLAHSTGSIILLEMELSFGPVKIQNPPPVQQKQQH
jgi:hypothetical protein